MKRRNARQKRRHFVLMPSQGIPSKPWVNWPRAASQPRQRMDSISSAPTCPFLSTAKRLPRRSPLPCSSHWRLLFTQASHSRYCTHASSAITPREPVDLSKSRAAAMNVRTSDRPGPRGQSPQPREHRIFDRNKQEVLRKSRLELLLILDIHVALMPHDSPRCLFLHPLLPPCCIALSLGQGLVPHFRDSVRGGGWKGGLMGHHSSRRQPGQARA